MRIEEGEGNNSWGQLFLLYQLEVKQDHRSKPWPGDLWFWSWLVLMSLGLGWSWLVLVGLG